MMQADATLPKLHNCLLVGDSGTGKTHLVESLSKIMKFPLLKIDATELNPTGASGGIKSDKLYKLILKCAKEAMEEDPETYWSLEGTVNQVVVFVDETDKLASSFANNNWNQHVQSNFLTVFENNGEFAGVSYIFAGAFTGIDKYPGEASSGAIGFVDNVSGGNLSPDRSFAEEIIKFGLLPEFVGRLNNIVLLDKLEKDVYETVLNTIIMPRTANTLAAYGIENFKLPEDKAEVLIDEAMKSGLGIRALESGISQLLVDIEFNPEEYIESQEEIKEEE
jgi:ATP-dependent Clp protease ATP-binding subunit ClpX